LNEEEFKATVQTIDKSGKHGPYALAIAEGLKGTVTFSLEKPVWKESSLPEPGHIVMVADLTQKRAGWRAQSARFFRPKDARNE
jgi:hypothetical protein